MNLRAMRLLMPLALLLSLPAAAMDHWSEAQKSVWDVVSASWEDDAGETGKWPGEYLHELAHSWSAGWPSPRDTVSIASWSRFGDESSDTLKYELFPLEVTVVGDTAVVHYGVVTVTSDHDGKRSREAEGLVETLTRTDDGWKFLGLTSFDIGDGED
ncbi:MAG: hypothetical protein R3323_02055 [Wenzhouxiangellaceae bacterium]|nr:hypothetical protein [Wenzhouxiangellaceae bacterium]